MWFRHAKKIEDCLPFSPGERRARWAASYYRDHPFTPGKFTHVCKCGDDARLHEAIIAAITVVNEGFDAPDDYELEALVSECSAELAHRKLIRSQPKETNHVPF